MAAAATMQRETVRLPLETIGLTIALVIAALRLRLSAASDKGWQAIARRLLGRSRRLLRTIAVAIIAPAIGLLAFPRRERLAFAR